MSRPVTLFTGQWADLPLEEVARLASSWGYDGLELACWGDHFEVDKALTDPGYIPAKKALLNKYGLGVWAISAHLVGQCVCDLIIESAAPGHPSPAHLRRTATPRVSGSAGAEVKDTARAGSRASASEPRPGFHRLEHLATW